MAFAATLDYNNRPHSRLALNHPPHHHPKQPQPGALLTDDIDGLDDSLLDSAMISPASAGDRRDSFANSTALFSPQSTNWEDFSAPALDRTQSMSNNPFFEQNNNPYTRLERPHIATFGQQPSSTWPLVDRTADSRTPFAHQAHDAYAGDFEPAQPYMTVGSSAPAYNGLPNMPSNVRPSSVFPPNAQGIETPNPLSPSDKWMTLNNDIDPRPLPKRMRQNSPPRPFSPGFPRVRGDGIRKKNARFEIPPERNLNTIDQMIAEASNEEDVKELKQQKRLLRNRQAALDSRQRKKKHTEDLEKEKSNWQERMAGLEEELANMRLQAEAYEMERLQWEQQTIQAQQQIQALVYEKEDIVAEHTRETGELRKKVSILTEKLNAKASGPATVTPCSTEFTDFASDMNGLTMDQDEWNNYIFVDPLFQEQDTTHQHPQSQAQSNNALVVASRPKQPQLVDADKPVASGLLLMLLLCGAYVATQSSATQAPPKLHMSDDFRADAATVLNDILKEASPPSNTQSTAHHMIANHVNGLEPGPSAVAGTWPPKATLSGAELASISGLGIDGSHLDQLHHNLVMPTKDQEAEQLFSLTANQYNSLTSTDFNRPAYPSDTPPTTDEGSTSPSSGRKTLAQALQSRHDEGWSGSKAAVYTRSLLGEQIPADIVREFQKMVQDSDSGTRRQSVKSET